MFQEDANDEKADLEQANEILQTAEMSVLRCSSDSKSILKKKCPGVFCCCRDIVGACTDPNSIKLTPTKYTPTWVQPPIIIASRFYEESSFKDEDKQRSISSDLVCSEEERSDPTMFQKCANDDKPTACKQEKELLKSTITSIPKCPLTETSTLNKKRCPGMFCCCRDIVGSCTDPNSIKLTPTKHIPTWNFRMPVIRSSSVLTEDEEKKINDMDEKAMEENLRSEGEHRLKLLRLLDMYERPLFSLRDKSARCCSVCHVQNNNNQKEEQLDEVETSTDGRYNSIADSSNLKRKNKIYLDFNREEIEVMNYDSCNDKSNHSTEMASNSPSSASSSIYCEVLWCKQSSRKHKKWEGDGILIITKLSAILKDLDGKEIAKGSGYKIKEINELEEGSSFLIGGKECQIQSLISEADYKNR